MAVSGCSMRESGYAMALWWLGELLTFGAAVRIAVAIGFGRDRMNTALVAFLSLALFFASGMVAEALSDVY